MNKCDENLLEKILKELAKMGDNYTLPYFTLGQKKNQILAIELHLSVKLI